MKVATVVLTHGNIPLTTDTVASIEANVGERVLVLVDKPGYPKFQNVKIGNAVVAEGLYHNFNRSPYRNYALGMKMLRELFPDSDWFLYSEYDNLFTSEAFKEDLNLAAGKRAWLVGFDLRRFDFETPLLADLIGARPERAYYFLGCCQFHHRDFVNTLYENNFYNKLIDATKDFQQGKFPGYKRYAYEEELWPTLAAHYGGKLYELCCWKKGDQGEHQSIKVSDPRMIYAGREHDNWRGRFKRYPVRNGPEITPEEVLPETSIVHPIKNAEHPIRRMFRDKRKKIKRLFI